MHLIRSYREVILDRPSVFRIEGIVTCTLIDAQTKRVIKEFTFKNTFTDAGLNWLATVDRASIGATIFHNSNTSAPYLAVGTGTSACLVTETALEGVNNGSFTQAADTGIGTTTPDQDEGYVAGPPSYNYGRRCVRFATGVANITIGKLGWYHSVSSPILICQARVKDGSGTPTTFPKTNTQLLDVTWETRIYPPADAVQTLTIAGISTDITAKHVSRRITDPYWAAGSVGNKNTHPNFIPTPQNMRILSRATGGGNALVSTNYYTDYTVGESGGSIAAYVAGSFTRDYTITIGPGVGRLIEVIYLARNSSQFTGGGNSPAHFGYSFNPIYTLPSTNVFTFVGRYAFGRYP